MVRLLGIFDGRQWGTKAKVHLIHPVFLVECPDLSPVPGSEMVDARFFMPDQLPTAMHPGHEMRVPKVIELARSVKIFFDPAESFDIDLPLHQRPDR